MGTCGEEDELCVSSIPLMIHEYMIPYSAIIWPLTLLQLQQCERHNMDTVIAQAVLDHYKTVMPAT